MWLCRGWMKTNWGANGHVVVQLETKLSVFPTTKLQIYNYYRVCNNRFTDSFRAQTQFKWFCAIDGAAEKRKLCIEPNEETNKQTNEKMQRKNKSASAIWLGKILDWLDARKFVKRKYIINYANCSAAFTFHTHTRTHSRWKQVRNILK